MPAFDTLGTKHDFQGRLLGPPLCQVSGVLIGVDSQDWDSGHICQHMFGVAVSDGGSFCHKLHRESF